MKTIIVTGAASGLGKAIAQEFDKTKCKLVLCDRNKINVNEYKNEVLVLELDITKKKNINKIYSQAIKKFKKIDIVINNAGVTLKKPFYEFNLSELDKIMAVNSSAVMLSTIVAYQHMNKGVIATISSLGGWFSPKNYSIYAASKHSVEGFFKSVKKDMDKPIKIKVFHPFRLNTNLNKHSKIKSPSKHRLDPRLYAEYVVACINGNRLKAGYCFLRNWMLWIKNIIFL